MHIDSGNMILFMKTARVHYMLVSFVDDLLFEDERDLKSYMGEFHIDPSNVWMISYNKEAFNNVS